MDEGKAISRTLEENAEDIWKLILDPRTYVYLAGLEKISEVLDKVMRTAAMAGYPNFRFAIQKK